MHCIRSVFRAPSSHTQHKRRGLSSEHCRVVGCVVLFLGEFKGKLLLVSVWVDGFSLFRNDKMVKKIWNANAMLT